MPSKSKVKAKVENTKGTVGYKDVVWCFNNLSASQLSEYDEKPLSYPEIMEGLHGLVESGFKISIRWDDYTDCPMATAVCNESGAINNGLATSARGTDFTDCLALLVFKILVCAEGDLTTFADEKPRIRRG